ncbi:MAG: adenine deaminase [Firmicutes bacterium]|nr:adenine deaminase [Bacillota bacterium]
MKIQCNNKKHLLECALGKVPADLCIKNARVINVFTGEILLGNVFICDGFISHVEYENRFDVDALEIYDAGGKYLAPGFIDAHIHIESSMLTPAEFARAVIPWGTTTVVTDPHEIANVWGTEGVRYMHDSSEGLPMRQLIDIPSCVPSVPSVESSGAEFLADDIRQLAQLERVQGLGEVMDFLAAANGEDRMLDILQAAEDEGLYLQGHAPYLSGRMLSAYTAAGPMSCHESRTAKEAIDKMRAGMYVDMRQSSISKDIVECWRGVKAFRFWDTLCLCTDDREVHEILENGHMNDVIKTAVECGMDPVLAIKSATINPAREMGIQHLGAIAPGYAADLVILPDLVEFRPSAVFYGGQMTAESGMLLADIPSLPFELEKRNSLNVAIPLSEENFRLRAPFKTGFIKVNVMNYLTLDSSSTEVTVEEFPVKNSLVDISADPDLKFVAVINRYGKERMALGVVRHFGTMRGAVGSTVSHDCHNITIVYDTPANAALACRLLLRQGGGMCAVDRGLNLCTLPLPVAGLMSTLQAEQLAMAAARMKKAYARLGLADVSNPLLRIVTLALPVIPSVKMSDVGLVDVSTKKVLPIFPEW